MALPIPLIDSEIKMELSMLENVSKTIPTMAIPKRRMSDCLLE